MRNGKRAKELARYAVELTQGHAAAPLDALAMSSAELGQFPDAVLTEVQAIQAAKAANQQDGLDLLQKHLETYQKKQPWRESFKVN